MRELMTDGEGSSRVMASLGCSLASADSLDE